MNDGFISYSRKDKEFVQSLYAALQRLGRETWVDWKDIQITEEWWKAIETGIEAADTFICILSPDYAASPVCYRETEHAVKHHKRLVPIVRREVAPGDVHPSLSAHNWLYMREQDDFDQAIATLVKALDTDLGHVRLHTRLLVRSLEWEREGYDPSFLLRDRDLESSEQWLQQAHGKDPLPTSLQVQYITAGQELRQRVRAQEAAYQQAQQELKKAIIYQKPRLRPVLLTSVGVTAVVLVLRFLGLLQSLELAAYDQLMRSRPDEGQDPRFLIVEVTETDIQAQISRGENFTGHLSDASLDRLLKALQSYQPRLIGMDVYRDFAAKPSDLAGQLRQNDRIYGICKVTSGEEPAIKPPPEIQPGRIGFNDVVRDGDGAIRRHLLVLEKADGSECVSEYAFSLLLAKRYLELDPQGENAYQQPLPAVSSLGGENLRLGPVVLERLQSFHGGYQFVDASGYQILLNYRSIQGDAEQPFETTTLEEVLNGSLSPEHVKDRIVLIGITASSAKDYLPTPYGAGAQQLPGVVIQAQMISQLLSAVLDERPLIWVWPQWGEALWVLGWSFLGGGIVWQVQRRLYLGVAVVTGLGSGLMIWVVVFNQAAGWVPLVPSSLGLVGTVAALVFIALRRPSPRPAPVSNLQEQSISNPSNRNV